MQAISTEKIPIKMWIRDIEDGALQQARNMANLPFAFRHIAIMPDSHQGYGMPIGGVLATKGVIVPNAVGVDIGCGMCATRFNISRGDISTDQMKQIMGLVRERIPMGFDHLKNPVPESAMPTTMEPLTVCGRQFESARHQLGTLGGGNHFIEFQRDTAGYLWAMIHSGSRNLGKQVADHYNKIAVEMNARWFSSVPKEWELAFLPIETREAKEYLAEMKYCVEFAERNRYAMMDRIVNSVHEVTGVHLHGDTINIAHNYARYEAHFGQNVVVHRKGATSAREGEAGIIPGSQGTKSYIVRGLGNKESFESCSHGAGRKMGRKAAQKELSLTDEIRRMNEKGIIHGIRTVNDLDEAAGAYKDIDEVMASQPDLVEITETLTPVAVIKA